MKNDELKACTGKAPVDKIREAFENIDISKDDPVLDWAQEYFTTSADANQHILACGFYKGYKSQQAEIERMKCIIEKMYDSRFEPDKLDIYRRMAKENN